MKCPHGNGPAERCSQCLGVPVRVVALGPNGFEIDGVPVPDAKPSEFISYGRRGGKTRRASTRNAIGGRHDPPPLFR